MRQLKNEKNGNNSCSCEACGRVYESAIKLTNLSAVPMQTYDACPFCFSKLDSDAVQEPSNSLKVPTSADLTIALEKNQENVDTIKQAGCQHHFGYLKKRPKNAPIPDECLTCQKMIQCLL